MHTAERRGPQRAARRLCGRQGGEGGSRTPEGALRPAASPGPGGVVLGLLLLAAALVPAAAHPVAQGAIELRIEPGRLVLDLHAALEQVLVQAAYGPAADAPLAERVRAHGEYLRAHLSLAADGVALAAGPPEPLPARPGRAAWRYVYALAAPAPRQLRLEQDVLREIDYAPGNPWEASYVLRVSGPHGERPGGLLASARPYGLDLAPSGEPGPDGAGEPGAAGSASASAGVPAPAGTALAVPARAYVEHGVRHILAGGDHLLFVGALAFGARRLRELVWLVGAFTLAHTLTLALSAYDVLRLPAALVEPAIAASIVVVAALNVLGAHDARTPVRRLACAFGFGLFHGLGFAGGLLDAFADLGGGAALAAILAFSVGVELGHLAVVLPLWGGLAALRRARAGADPGGLRRGASAAISIAGLGYLAAALGHGPLA